MCTRAIVATVKLRLIDECARGRIKKHSVLCHHSLITRFVLIEAHLFAVIQLIGGFFFIFTVAWSSRVIDFNEVKDEKKIRN